jgi:hypothetical protein
MFNLFQSLSFSDFRTPSFDPPDELSSSAARGAHEGVGAAGLDGDDDDDEDDDDDDVDDDDHGERESLLGSNNLDIKSLKRQQRYITLRCM